MSQILASLKAYDVSGNVLVRGQAIRQPGYAPELRWRRSVGVGTSVVCTTGEALANEAFRRLADAQGTSR